MRIIGVNWARRSLLFWVALLTAALLLGFVCRAVELDRGFLVTSAKARDACAQKNTLLLDAIGRLGVAEPQAAAEIWASGLKERSAALQYAVMTEALKQKYSAALKESFPNWVTGVSSPWVDSWEFVRIDAPDENRYVFDLKISTMTSAGPAGEHKAILTVVTEDGFWRISNIAIDEGLYPYLGFMPQ